MTMASTPATSKGEVFLDVFFVDMAFRAGCFLAIGFSFTVGRFLGDFAVDVCLSVFFVAIYS